MSAASGLGPETLLRRAAKRLRYSQPFNAIVTAAVRACLRSFGTEWVGAVKHLHRVGPVVSTLPNGTRMRLWSRADDWVSNQVFWKEWKGYEPETSPLFFEYATRARATLDIGAYVGFFTLLAAHANPQAQVVAFEPLPPVFRRLQVNVRRNSLDNVVCVNAAVGSSVGRADFFHTALGLPCSSSLSLRFMEGTSGLTQTEVEVTTIDQFLAEHPLDAIDLVKIDTESTEPEVLSGMSGLLDRSRPVIFCEVLPGQGTGAALARILEPLGYAFFHLRPEGPARVDQIVGHPESLNYLFAVPGKNAPEEAFSTTSGPASSRR
jgi:FkbM family methyltransferase